MTTSQEIDTSSSSGRWEAGEIASASPAVADTTKKGSRRSLQESALDIEIHAGLATCFMRWRGGTFCELVRRTCIELEKELLALIPGWELPPPGTARWGLLGLEEAPHKVMDVFRMSFYLHHEQFGVAYEYFDPADIYHGARITVSMRLLQFALREFWDFDRDRKSKLTGKVGGPGTIGSAVKNLGAYLTSGGTRLPDTWEVEEVGRAESCLSNEETSPTGNAQNTSRTPREPSSPNNTAADGAAGEASMRNDFAGDERPPMSHLARVLDDLRNEVWETLDNPSKSHLSLGFMVTSMMLIGFSTSTFCLETTHEFYEREPSKDSWMYMAEVVCISFFTAEAMMRMLTCPNLREYLSDWMNLIDIIAILPFYLTVAAENLEVPGLEVLRVVRLVRVFRLFKMSRSSVSMFTVTMRESFRPLYMLAAITLIAVILFASATYYLERGSWNEHLQVWERVIGYKCTIMYPDMLKDGKLHQNLLNCWVEDDVKQELQLSHDGSLDQVNMPLEIHCIMGYKRSSNCTRLWGQTPFDSIPTTMPFIFETMVTVGYGSDLPTLDPGYCIGAVIVLGGMLVIALPITVVGSNFATVYRELHRHETEEREEDNDDDPTDVFHDIPPTIMSTVTGTRSKVEAELRARMGRKPGGDNDFLD